MASETPSPVLRLAAFLDDNPIPGGSSSSIFLCDDGVSADAEWYLLETTDSIFDVESECIKQSEQQDSPPS